MATDAFYPNNGIYPPQQHADLVCVAMRHSKSHDESRAETKRLLGADAEPRHPSNNATDGAENTLSLAMSHAFACMCGIDIKRFFTRHQAGFKLLLLWGLKAKMSKERMSQTVPNS